MIQKQKGTYDVYGNTGKKIVYLENYKSTINEMIDNKEVETYKWTFKKQSDGKYYFYSGEWQ